MEQIHDWMNELLPDGAADIGVWQQPECTSVKAERPNSCQLPVGSNPYPRNLSQHPPQLMQPSAGCNSASLMAKCELGSLNVLQHSDQTTFQRILETKGGLVLEHGNPRLQMPALHQSQNLTLADQLKPGNQTQAMPFGTLQASSESTSRVDLTNSIDWVNSTYQKILQMKEMYLNQFIMLHHKMQELKRQATDAEIASKVDKNKVFIERTIRLLNISKSELMQLKMERVCQVLNDAMKFIAQIRQKNSLYQRQPHQVDAHGILIEAPHTQPRDNHLQFNSAPVSLNQPSRPGGALGLPQSTLKSYNIGSSATAHASSTVNSYQYNLMRPTQQWAYQGNVARKGGPQIGFDPRAIRMYSTGGVPHYNNLSTLQQTLASSRNIFNPLDYSINPIAQTPVSMPPLQSSQQDQAIKRQKMKQPAQQLMADKCKQQMIQKRTEDTKLQHFVGINQKWSPALLPSSSPYALSPQNSQQSSSQLELKDTSSKFPKSATPSLSASTSALPSPLTPLTLTTPLTPSSMQEDSIKSPLLEERSKLTKNPTAASQPPLQDTIHNHLASDTQTSNKSGIHRESTSFGDKKSSQDKGDPLKRLVEAVKSVSSKSLNATLRDINAVTSLTDRAAGNFLRGKSTKVIVHDLTDDMISNCNEGTFILEDSIGMTPGMKRELASVALDDLTPTDSEFGASRGIKRLKTEPNNLLLEEVKEINQKLIEIVVDVTNLEDVSRLRSDEGALVRCSYIPVGLSGNTKIPHTSKLMFPNLLLELIVSNDYPNSSPTVLEEVPSDFCDADEGKYLWMKAKTNFTLSLRKFSMPISVKDMAEAWDISAREVFHELVEKMGGGSFSSSYGKWENCAVAV